jgi:hypothetical protein
MTRISETSIASAATRIADLIEKRVASARSKNLPLPRNVEVGTLYDIYDDPSRNYSPSVRRAVAMPPSEFIGQLDFELAGDQAGVCAALERDDPTPKAAINKSLVQAGVRATCLETARVPRPHGAESLVYRVQIDSAPANRG